MRCGCTSATECGCSMTGSDCIGMAGIGSGGDPMYPFLVLSDDARNNLECRDDGAHVSEWEDAVAIESAAALTLPATGSFFRINGTTSVTSISDAAGNSGRVVTLVFTGVLTMTDGGNLALAGNFATTANDTMQLASDGATWFEIGRSVN